MNPEIERRNIDLIELRMVEDEGQKPKIRGYAAVFNKLSEDLGGFKEKIDPGTFKKSIEKDDIRALFNHDANYILGRNKAGTLTLTEDEKGLNIEIDPPDTQYARDLQESIKRGDINQMSFGFVVINDSWDFEKGKEAIRTLKEVRLFDVSPVTYPAYPQTSVKIRSYIEDHMKSLDAQGSTPSEGATDSLDLYKRKIEIAELN